MGSAPSGIRPLLEQVRKGDVVVVTKLDRLARSTAELLRISVLSRGHSTYTQQRFIAASTKISPHDTSPFHSALRPIFAAVVAYVFFGLQAVTNELELPFRNVQNGLPLDALCRTIEISVSEALHRHPPAALSAANHVLT